MTRYLRLIDDTFFESAPFTLSAAMDLPHSPEQARAAMTGDQMGSWVTGLDRAKWLSPRPLGQGAMRSLRIGRIVTITEEYYNWEDLRRMTFRVTQITHPLMSGWAEDMWLDALPGGGTHLGWRMALDSRLLRIVKVPRVLEPLLAKFSRKMISGILTILPEVR